MTRYINANSLYDKVEAIYKYATGDKREIAKTFLDLICEEPTADVVEIVRCDKCTSAEMYCFGGSPEAKLVCVVKENGEIRFARAVCEDEFCSRGNRKEEVRE